MQRSTTNISIDSDFVTVIAGEPLRLGLYDGYNVKDWYTMKSDIEMVYSLYIEEYDFYHNLLNSSCLIDKATVVYDDENIGLHDMSPRSNTCFVKLKFVCENLPLGTTAIKTANEIARTFRLFYADKWEDLLSANSLITFSATECNKLKQIKYPYKETDELSLQPVLAVQNLTIEDAFPNLTEFDIC